MREIGKMRKRSCSALNNKNRRRYATKRKIILEPPDKGNSFMYKNRVLFGRGIVYDGRVQTTVIICIRCPKLRVGDASIEPLSMELLL